MRIFKKVLSLTIIVALLAGICVMSTISSSASGTGAGLAEWALNAYNSGWSYVYGGASPGAVDCSGLIYSYAGGIRTGDAQLNASNYTGSVSSGVPRIHGLGLWKPGHVGVYVGNDMAVDARGSQWGVCYESVYTHGWTTYFKVSGVSYPTNGWVKFNGAKYYYEKGQYIVNTTRTIDGVTYTFGSNGKCTSSSAASTESSSSAPTATLPSTLKVGSTGEKVVKLQTRLSELGYYNGVIDGHFGKGTEEAFKLFQKTAGLYVDGLAGNDVNYLYADDAPRYVAEEEEETVELELKSEKIEAQLAATSLANDETEEDTQEEENDETAISYSKGDFSEEIVNIQVRLSELSYYTGTPDGSFGSKTEEAVKLFQNTNNLTQTGVVDELTHEALFSDTAIKNTVTDATEMPVVNSELPKSALKANNESKTQPTEAPATEVVLETNKLSQKALAGIADSMGFDTPQGTNNFQFIFWLLVMIVVMTITFAVINTIEKKKSGRKVSREYF